jgi:hypothetical protein
MYSCDVMPVNNLIAFVISEPLRKMIALRLDDYRLKKQTLDSILTKMF